MAAEIRIDPGDLKRLNAVFMKLSTALRAKVEPRALNRVGDMVYTRVVRQVAEETGAQQKRVRHGARKVRAGARHPAYQIVMTGEFMSLKDFRPRQTAKGVSAAPWGKRRVFPGTFFGPGGHVYRRTGIDRKIAKLWGPAVPRELVRGEGPTIVRAVVNSELPRRLIHEAEREIAKAKREERL